MVMRTSSSFFFDLNQAIEVSSCNIWDSCYDGKHQLSQQHLSHQEKTMNRGSRRKKLDFFFPCELSGFGGKVEEEEEA